MTQVNTVYDIGELVAFSIKDEDNISRFFTGEVVVVSLRIFEDETNKIEYKIKTDQNQVYPVLENKVYATLEDAIENDLGEVINISATPTPTPSTTPDATQTPTPTGTSTPTPTTTQSLSPTPTMTPTPTTTQTLTATPSPTATNTPTPSVSLSSTPDTTPTPTPSISLTPSISESVTPTPTTTQTVTATQTMTPTPTFTPTPSSESGALWSIANASEVDSKSLLDVSDLSGIAIRQDGTRIFVCSFNSDSIYQYSLSTPWDLSTITYDSITESGRDNVVNGVFVGQSGTKMYTVGTSDDEIEEYDLGSSWDLSTASPVRRTNISPNSENPEDVFIGDGGTKAYIAHANGVSQYDLSTPWNVSTLSFVNNKTNFFNPPKGIFLKDDGTKLYTSYGNGEIDEFTLTTPWDITTTTNRIMFNPSLIDIEGIAIGNSGSFMFAVDGNTIIKIELGPPPSPTPTATQTPTPTATPSITPSISQSATPTPTPTQTPTPSTSVAASSTWDLSLASDTGVTYDVNSEIGFTMGMTFKPDGTKFYLSDRDSNTIYEYQMSTPWDISTASYTNSSFSVSAQDTDPTGIRFNNDGTLLIMSGAASSRIYQYSLSTAYDISTMSYDAIFESSGDTDVGGIAFGDNGQYLYRAGNDSDGIISWSLSTPYDITTNSNAGFYSISSEETAPTGIFAKPDGTHIYVLGNINNAILDYSLSTPWDITTATFSTQFGVGISIPTGMYFKPDGTAFYVIGNNNVMKQFSLT